MLFKQLNFIKAQNSYNKSIKRNQEQLKKDFAEIKIKQSLKNLDKFSRAIKEI